MRTAPQNYANVSNQIVEAKKLNELSLQQQRFFVFSLQTMQRKIKHYEASNTKIDWELARSGCVDFREFGALFEVGENNHDALRKSIKSMTTFSMMVRYQNKDEDYFPVFANWRFSPSSSKIYWKFNDVFNELFLDLKKGFFTISIEEIATFESTYAITLYMLLKSKINMDKKIHEYTISKLKDLLTINAKKYANYKDFRVRVLDVAKKYIDQSPASAFTFNYEPIKEGKKVTGVKFTLEDKRNEGNYYESKGLLPNYKKHQEYKKYQKLTKHPELIISELAKRIIEFFDEHGMDFEQKLFKMYQKQLHIELDDFNTKSNQQELGI